MTGLRRIAGFTTLELLMVVLIMLLAFTIAVPNMVAVIANSRMRASMTSLSGVVQNTRMMAVQKNTTMTTRFTTLGGGLVAYAKPSADASALATADPQVQLQAPVSKYTAPTGVGAPAALTTAQLGFTANTSDASFNSRGLPCLYSAGACTSKGFVFYFKDTSRPAGLNWAAISISPAGRIKRWFWSGSTWVD